MNAKEARQKAEAFNMETMDKQYADIMDKIEASSSKGNFSIFYPEVPHTEVKRTLISMGYQVSSYADRDGSSQTTITW